MNDQPVIVHGPGPWAITAAVAGSVLAGLILAAFTLWLILGCPLPARWPEPGPRRWWRATTAVCRVTWGRLHRAVHRHRPPQDEPTLRLPRPRTPPGGSR